MTNKQASAPTLTFKSKKGIERVNKLLKVTAQIIVRDGIDTLSVKKITEESHTSASSFYHFFPNINILIDMLTNHHASYIANLIEELKKDFIPTVWYKKSTTNLVYDLFYPFAEYLMNNKDYLIELHNKNSPFVHSSFFIFLKQVLWAKYPDWSESKIEKESDILYALAIGMLMQIYKQKQDIAYDFIPDILKVIIAYLSKIETEEG